ncbi:MAG: hypothetical protein CMG17_07160 [Candidatus Marinimicrobia bacterium]|jgi:hypothetical protein|nr:hypothetical protein [Candidatus Neomarinimicrobiota bacterium]|tara:strand:- start:1529 stop:2068 length:540 start_codon:yes stop_codon:yes gene_type:complete
MATTGSGNLTAWDRQIRNRNFLSPVGFKFNLQKAPTVDFFSQSANIPSINLGVAIQSTYLKDIPVPGDKLVFNDFSIRFLVDENLKNYLEISNWMRGLGYPESLDEAIPLNTEAFSDGGLVIFNSSMNAIARVNFKDMFPTDLTQLEFDAQNTDINYIVAEATFKYTVFDIVSLITDDT